MYISKNVQLIRKQQLSIYKTVVRVICTNQVVPFPLENSVKICVSPLNNIIYNDDLSKMNKHGR